MTTPAAVHLTISGLVQGVFYRKEAREAALTHSLKGWIKNRSDGSVECVVEGMSSSIEAFIRWAEKGSNQARVDAVNVKKITPTGNFTQFEIRSF